MLSYYSGLLCLKKILLIGEAITLLIRLVFQVLFTLPSSLLVVQVMLATVIHCRKNCEPQAQMYILINFIIIYSMIYNQFFMYFYGDSQSNPLVQNFKNNYKLWGYIYEGLFRILGTMIGWRCYQFSKLFEQQNGQQDPLDI